MAVFITFVVIVISALNWHNDRGCFSFPFSDPSRSWHSSRSNN